MGRILCTNCSVPGPACRAPSFWPLWCRIGRLPPLVPHLRTRYSKQLQFNIRNISQQYVTAVCHSSMSQQYVTAVCHSSMSQEYITAVCHSSMSQQYVTAVCHSTMSQQYVAGVYHSNMPHQYVTAFTWMDTLYGGFEFTLT